MSDVGLAAVAAVVVFGGLIYLANRFNESEIRRTRRKHLREILANTLTDLRASGDRIEGTHGGVPIRVEGGWTPGMRIDEVALTTSATIEGGRLAAFSLASITLESVAREGLPTDLVPHNGMLERASLTCDGTTVHVRATQTWSILAAVGFAAEMARVPDRVLSHFAQAAKVGAADVSATHSLHLGTEARPITVTIDRGFRCVITAPPLSGLESGSIGKAIASVREHVRGPELEALASELTGTLEIERRPEGDRLSLTLPLATPTERLLRAVELVERLTEPERSAFR